MLKLEICSTLQISEERGDSFMKKYSDTYGRIVTNVLLVFNIILSVAYNSALDIPKDTILILYMILLILMIINLILIIVCKKASQKDYKIS